jgi:Ctr copper transporter family
VSYYIVYLVPQDAIILDFPQRTFADMRKAMVLHGSKSQTYSNIEGEDVVIDDDVSIGCGVSSASSSLWSSNGGETRINRRRLQMVDDASACNNVTNFYCWMSCLSIPDAQNASEKMKDGFSLYCLDEAELATTNNVTAAYKQCNTFGIHNDGCAGTWLPTVPDVPSQEVIVDEETIAATPMKFCYGGTSMYMDGFHWTNPTCVIYLFPNWILSSAGLLTGASIGTIFFGIVLEAVIAKRRSVVQSFPLGWKRLTISTLFYGLQLTLGYLIMLVVMTYSGPLFMCVIFGLMGGHAIFNAGSGNVPNETKVDDTAMMDNETEVDQQNSGSDRSASAYTNKEIPEGFTPCCQNSL